MTEWVRRGIHDGFDLFHGLHVEISFPAARADVGLYVTNGLAAAQLDVDNTPLDTA